MYGRVSLLFYIYIKIYPKKEKIFFDVTFLPLKITFLPDTAYTCIEQNFVKIVSFQLGHITILLSASLLQWSNFRTCNSYSQNNMVCFQGVLLRLSDPVFRTKHVDFLMSTFDLKGVHFWYFSINTLSRCYIVNLVAT